MVKNVFLWSCGLDAVQMFTTVNYHIQNPYNEVFSTNEKKLYEF